MTGSHQYIEVVMTAHSKVFSTWTRCLLVSVAMAVLGFAWGCGDGVSSQATLDDAAKARVQQAHDSEKKFMDKMEAKAARGKTGRLSKKDLEP
jgi:hypothetical protein